MFIYKCENKECVNYNKERKEHKVTSVYDANLEQVITKQQYCPKCNTYCMDCTEKKEGYTTNMIGKNIGNG